MIMYCMTSDKHQWLMQGFMHQWHKYAPELNVVIAGFTKPNFDLLPGFDFYSIGRFDNYPVDKWSNALIDLLLQTEDEQVGILLEDYWLIRKADAYAVVLAGVFLEQNPDALRFDLTSDRLYCGAAEDYAFSGIYDIIKAGQSPYQMSLQASMWNKSRLLEILKPNRSPWDVEHEGTGYLADHPMPVYGYRQIPLRYIIAMRAGKFERDGSWCFPKRQIVEDDWEELDRLGYTSPPKG